MKLIVIPPYRGVNYTPEKGHFMVRELMANMEEKGQLEGVEVDIDEGHPTEHTAETRDEEVLANITTGLLKRVRMYCEGEKYDAIVTSGGMEPFIFAARLVSKIPVACSIHSAVHVASLIGDRFAIIHTTDPSALIARRCVQKYGLSHKLVSVRYIGHSTTSMMRLIRKYKKEERIKVPEVRKLIDDIMAHCVTAIKEDRVDSLILGSPQPQCFEDEIGRRLDEAGYDEIPIVCGLSAAVEMAKAMVNMKLMQAPKVYPSDALKAKPKFR